MIWKVELQVDEPTQRRLERAAKRQNTDVQTYCLMAVKQKLSEDDLLALPFHVLPEKRPFDHTFIADLRLLHDEILVTRNGKLVDVDAMLDEVREDHERDILGLR